MLQERGPLARRDAQVLGQQFCDLAGWPALVGLDLLDCHLGAANATRKLALREVERLAPPPHPIAERGWHIHRAILTRHTVVCSLYALLYHFDLPAEIAHVM